MTTKQIFVAAIGLCMYISTGLAQDLFQWRGVERSGIYHETGLLKEWPAEGPQLLWHYDGLGLGFTSVTIVNDRIYTTGVSEDKGYVFALDKQGKLLWKECYGNEWNQSYPGTRTTPVYFKGKLYLATGLGEAICLDAKNGKKLWSVDMKEKYGTRVLRWGIVEAPVVFNDRVIFTPGGDKATFVAFNLNTGKVVWESKTSDETSAYCSPLLYTYKNKTYLTTSLSKNLVGIDVNTGKLVWQTPQVSQRSIHPNTPLYKEGRIYSLVGYGKGGIMVKLSDDGQSASELWTNTSLDNHIGGAVWIDNYIVSSGHQNDRSWQCLDANTGNVLYKNNELGQGAVVYADGLFYCYADNGEMGIMEIGADGLKLKSKFRITLGTDQHWAHPVIHEGVMYIRHGNTLMAYKVKK